MFAVIRIRYILKDTNNVGISAIMRDYKVTTCILENYVDFF